MPTFSAWKSNILNNLEKYSIDGLMNAANGIGPMGRGIAGAIRRAGGDSIMEEATFVCKLKDPRPGEAYYTTAGTLPVKNIIHAVTMKKPGGPTSLSVCAMAFRRGLELANVLGIKTLGCTALGTGVGKLDAAAIGSLMAEIAVQTSKINVVFMDLKPEFIDAVNEIIA